MSILLDCFGNVFCFDCFSLKTNRILISFHSDYGLSGQTGFCGSFITRRPDRWVNYILCHSICYFIYLSTTCPTFLLIRNQIKANESILLNHFYLFDNFGNKKTLQSLLNARIGTNSYATTLPSNNFTFFKRDYFCVCIHWLNLQQAGTHHFRVHNSRAYVLWLDFRQRDQTRAFPSSASFWLSGGAFKKKYLQKVYCDFWCFLSCC